MSNANADVRWDLAIVTGAIKIFKDEKRLQKVRELLLKDKKQKQINEIKTILKDIG